MRVMMTSAYGVKADISDKIEDLLRIGQYADAKSEMSTRRIAALGYKLTVAGGRLAPAAVLVAVEPYLSQDYANHIAVVWRLNDIDEAEINADDVPTISISGLPPTGRLRTPATLR